MMPALAREMSRREHDLVLGDPLDGLAAELSGLGARVEVVDGAEDQTKPDTIQEFVDRAHEPIAPPAPIRATPSCIAGTSRA
jgi:hypothetical protein